MADIQLSREVVLLPPGYRERNGVRQRSQAVQDRPCADPPMSFRGPWSPHPVRRTKMLETAPSTKMPSIAGWQATTRKPSFICTESNINYDCIIQNVRFNRNEANVVDVLDSLTTIRKQFPAGIDLTNRKMHNLFLRTIPKADVAKERVSSEIVRSTCRREPVSTVCI
ncbi:conserved hypothetical protein [Culex quinquefasciatus]|uniref:Uncharacterized protein n=1 Tax=Culex quinquefasciatus TaxID=7176 RepID=B0W828_CULQU|nr:conserved hypothetical protein [Culex quinquefasciatus]|eukprot:XP_001844862.1 conserved hypothetical protein [Culex quinquefasciatus]